MFDLNKEPIRTSDEHWNQGREQLRTADEMEKARFRSEDGFDFDRNAFESFTNYMDFITTRYIGKAFTVSKYIQNHDIERFSSICDIGCGVGAELFFLRRATNIDRIYGVDFDRVLISKLNSLKPDLRVDFVTLDMEKEEDINSLPDAQLYKLSGTEFALSDEAINNIGKSLKSRDGVHLRTVVKKSG